MSPSASARTRNSSANAVTASVQRRGRNHAPTSTGSAASAPTVLRPPVAWSPRKTAADGGRAGEREDGGRAASHAGRGARNAGHPRASSAARAHAIRLQAVNPRPRSGRSVVTGCYRRAMQAEGGERESAGMAGVRRRAAARPGHLRERPGDHDRAARQPLRADPADPAAGQPAGAPRGLDARRLRGARPHAARTPRRATWWRPCWCGCCCSWWATRSCCGRRASTSATRSAPRARRC